jgi:succinate-semialdehyde dehydrogenase/glutarate-semialdehyde dehydrogenase
MAKMVVGNEPYDAISGDTYEIRNPATGEVVDTVPKGSAEDVRAIVDVAEAGFKAWSQTPHAKRAELLLKAGELIHEHTDEIAELLTKEQGKTLKESQIEARRLGDNMIWFAGLAEKIRGDYVPLSEPGKYGMVIKRPIGVVGAIVPWNFPLTLMANKIAPGLAVGNAMIVKPASTAPLAILRSCEVINMAGLPAGALNVVTGPGGVVGEEMIAHPRIRKIGFTGETETGKHVMEVASRELKHVTLELGGSDPMIVCDDADIDAAASAASVGRFFNCGQACLAVKRLYVFDSVYDEFMQRFIPRAQRLKVGNGMDPASRMGPLHTAGQRTEIEQMVEDALSRGAKVVYGAKRPEGDEYAKGNFYMPTILENVSEDALIVREECFGPAIPVFRVSGLEEAIEKANSSKYGLGSSIWTRDLRKSRIAAEQIEAGYTWVNSLQVAYDELPFGGTKWSGFGKEHGVEAINFYTEAKSVVIGAA